MKRRAFTLVEVMIVILLISILAGIAVPNFLRSRDSSRTRTCISSLRATEYAKEMWAMAEKQPAGAACVVGNLVPDYLKMLRVCPSGGTYDLKTVGERTECSIGTPHTL